MNELVVLTIESGFKERDDVIGVDQLEAVGDAQDDQLIYLLSASRLQEAH